MVVLKFYQTTKNPMNKKILLVIPCYTWEIHDEVRKAIDKLIVPDWYELEEKVLIRTMVHVARNFAIKLALNGWFDYLLFCDDDNAPEPDALKLLLDADKDIIGWIIRWRQFPHKLCIFDQEPDADGFRHYIQFQRMPIVDNDVFEIANTWTGFILYKRAVLEKLREEYDHNPFEFKVAHYVQFINWSLVELEKAFPKFLPIFKYQKDGSIKIFHMPISEDLLFHERAKYYGFHIYAHKKVCLKHYDTTGEFYSVEDEDDVDDCNDDL